MSISDALAALEQAKLRQAHLHGARRLATEEQIRIADVIKRLDVECDAADKAVQQAVEDAADADVSDEEAEQHHGPSSAWVTGGAATQVVEDVDVTKKVDADCNVDGEHEEDVNEPTSIAGPDTLPEIS